MKAHFPHSLVFLALLALLAFPASAQYNHWEVGLNGSYAAPNNFEMMGYACGAASVDVTWVSRQTGNEYWRLYKHYPSFGLRASFAYIPEAIYGHRFGLVGLVRAPLGKWVGYSIGLGLSTYTKAQCFTGDEENLFISSPVSCLIDVGFNFRIGDDVMLNVSLLHSSNGMLYRPNKGVNFLQLGIAAKIGNGYEKSLDWEHSRSLIDSVPSFHSSEWNVALSGGTAMSRDSQIDGYFPCYDLSIYYQSYVNPVFAFGGAIDLWYNGTHWEPIRRDESNYRLPLYLSGMGMMEFFWGPLSLKAGLGLVVVASNQVTIPMYERVGVYYNFGRNYVGVALNATAGRIEFIEWTYGRRFF